MKLGTRIFGRKSESSGGGDEAIDGGSAASKGKKGRGGNGLYLYVSNTSWQARFVSADGDPAERPVGEEAVRPIEGRPPAIEDVIRQAIEKIGKRTFASIGFVVLVLNDPKIAMVENGGAASGFSPTNVSAIRNFGQEHLGVDEISFGYFQMRRREPALPATAAASSGMYGFIDIENLRDYLAAFGDIAQKVVAVTPAPFVTIMAGRDGTGAEETRCDLFVSASASVISISNPRHAVAVVRSIPVGTHTIAAALAETQGLRIDKALEEMKRRNCMESIRLDEFDSDASDVPSQFERVLGPLLRRFAEEIETSMSFFAGQRAVLADGGKNLAVHGLGDQIRGLNEWLSQRLKIPVASAVVHCADEAKRSLFRASSCSICWPDRRGPCLRSER